MTVLRASHLLLQQEMIEDGWVEIADGWVVAAGHGTPPEAADDMFEGLLSPGLVDLQLNGAFGVDWASSGFKDWVHIVNELPSTGVTSFVPTIVTAPLEQMASNLGHFRTNADALRQQPGARPLGLHVEGPFLSVAQRGAHHEGWLRRPTPQNLDALLAVGSEEVLYITLAPELEGAIDATRELVANGIRVSIGHSDATEEEVIDAVDAGASLVTHLYNAQRGFHHREPGVVGTALTDPRLALGLIADGHHVSPRAIHLAFASANGRIALVTDATAAMGAPPGVHDLGGGTISVPDDGGPPVQEDGTIAGSSLSLDQAVANTIAAGVDPASALLAATRTPADAIGRPELGRIAAGALADLVLFDDAYRVQRTWVGGHVVTANNN